MARFSRLDVLNTLLDKALVPLFYHANIEVASAVATACAAGGARLIEFTNRGEDAHPVFAELVRRGKSEAPDLIVGVGSIVDAPTAALYIASGANFVVGPSFSPEIARLCNRRKIPYIPGCATETEIETAEEWGAEVCKIFPGNAGGPEFIRAVLGPCPWHRLMPTGGIDATEESVTRWIRAGAAALGMGSKLITDSVVASRDFGALTQKVIGIDNWIQKARS